MKIVRENLLNLSLSNLILENMQQAKAILKRKNIEENNEVFQEIKQMLLDDNRINYIGKFTKWVFEDNEPLDKLKSTYKLLKDYPYKVPSIDTFKTLESLYDYLQGEEISSKVNQVINAIPSRTRTLVNEKLRKLIELNIQHANNIKDFYSKKGGKFKNSNDLYNETKTLIDNLSGSYNLETILKKIKEKNSNVTILAESPNILIIRPNDFKASSDLGSRSWCISTDLSYWKSYTDFFNNQYFLYDFSKDISDKTSMIGITVNTDGEFSAAHFKDDSANIKIDGKEMSAKDYVKDLLNM